MSKTKKIISLLLTVVLVMTMATVAIVSSSALADGEFHVVAGAEGLCGSGWNPADTNNQMTWNADKGIYEKIYTNVAAGSYEFKVTTGGAWDNGDFNLEGDARYGGPNAVANVEVNGSTVIIGFDGSKALLEITADPVVEPTTSVVEPTTAVVEPTTAVVEPTTAASGDDTVTVYFTNNWKFLSQNIYWWIGDTPCADWPGLPMTFVETNENGDDIFTAEVPANADGIIFAGHNDQNPEEIRQTVDILDFADNTGYYCDSVNEADGKINVGTYDPKPVDPTTAVVEPTTAVVEPTTAVVEPTTAVVEPTTAVVEPTTAVVEPTTAVVEPTTAVVEPTTAVVEPTTAVVEPTEPIVTEKGVAVAGKTYDARIGDEITYTLEIKAAELFENVQAIVTYDADKLELVATKGSQACPDIANGLIFNAGEAGVVKFNASNYEGYDFTEGKALITLKFNVKDDALSTIATVIEEMTIVGDGTQSYFSGSQAVITEGITVAETLTVPEHPTDPEPTQPEPTKPEPTKPEPTKPEPTSGKDEPTKPVNTDFTSNTDNTVDGGNKPVDTGATAYIYIALAIVAMAAAAVVVLRKRANG